jgi:hypothetical protein
VRRNSLTLDPRVAAFALAAAVASGAGCDAGSAAPADAGVDAASAFACTVPATPPSGGSCVTTGTSAVSCNPVTNAGCSAGQACDITADSSEDITGFTCFDGPNDALLCEPCGVTGGASCAGGLSCANVNATWLACAHYCCSDADCGSGHCQTTDTDGRSLFGMVASGLGFCASAAIDGG